MTNEEKEQLNPRPLGPYSSLAVYTTPDGRELLTSKTVALVALSPQDRARHRRLRREKGEQP